MFLRNAGLHLLLRPCGVTTQNTNIDIFADERSSYLNHFVCSEVSLDADGQTGMLTERRLLVTSQTITITCHMTQSWPHHSVRVILSSEDVKREIHIYRSAPCCTWAWREVFCGLTHIKRQRPRGLWQSDHASKFSLTVKHSIALSDTACLI
jgi:hypothetical protein